MPQLIENHLRSQLVSRGFPDANLEVASIGLAHLNLRNVHIDEGFDIGSLKLNRGLSLLWSNADDVSISGAQVTTKALAASSHALRRSGSGTLPFNRAEIVGSTVEVAGKRTALTATAARSGSTLEIAVTLRDPTPAGWTATGTARVVLGKTLELEAGHVDITVPSGSIGKGTITDTTLSADVTGNLSTRTFAGAGKLHASKIAIGAFELSDATVPFKLDQGGLHVWGARASTSGGELAVDPFVASGEPVDLVLRARGLQLGRLLAPTRRMTGTGRIDGQLALRVGGGGWSVTSGQLRARDQGALQLTDRTWRENVAQAQSPLAVHAKIAGALTDFQYSALTVDLAPRGGEHELRFTARGRGRRNHQELDLAVAVHGVRDLVTRLPGAAP